MTRLPNMACWKRESRSCPNRIPPLCWHAKCAQCWIMKLKPPSFGNKAGQSIKASLTRHESCERKSTHQQNGISCRKLVRPIPEKGCMNKLKQLPVGKQVLFTFGVLCAILLIIGG